METDSQTLAFLIITISAFGLFLLSSILFVVLLRRNPYLIVIAISCQAVLGIIAILGGQSLYVSLTGSFLGIDGELRAGQDQAPSLLYGFAILMFSALIGFTLREFTRFKQLEWQANGKIDHGN